MEWGAESAAPRKPYSNGGHSPLLRKPLSWPGVRPPWRLHQNPPYFTTLLGTPRGGLHDRAWRRQPPGTATHLRIQWEAPGCGTPHGLLCLSPPALIRAPGVQVAPQRSLPHLSQSTSFEALLTVAVRPRWQKHLRAATGTRHRQSSETQRPETDAETADSGTKADPQRRGTNTR